MSSHSAVADIGKGIVELLRDKLVPETVKKNNHIGICSPKNRGDCVVGLHQYSMAEESLESDRGVESLPDGGARNVGTQNVLYYVISVSSSDDSVNESNEETKILSRISQVMTDNAILSPIYLPAAPNGEKKPIVTMKRIDVDTDEKSRIWGMFGASYQPSLHYEVGPITVDSEIFHKPKKRVETVQLETTEFIPVTKPSFETKIKEEDIEDEWTTKPDENADESENSEDSFGTDDYGENTDSDSSATENEDMKDNLTDDPLDIENESVDESIEDTPDDNNLSKDDLDKDDFNLEDI